MDFGPNFEGKQACLKVNPDIFFPTNADRAGFVNAKTICASCEVIEPCLQYAVRHPSLDGIWGGTTPRQRETIRSRMRKEKAYQ